MKQFERVRKRRLGELLVDEGYITPEQLEDGLAAQKQTGDLLGKVLVDQGFLNERALARAIANQLQLPYLSTENYQLNKETVGLIPPDLCFKYEFIPVDKFGNMLTILMSGLLSVEIIETIQQLTGCDLFVFIGTTSDVQAALKEWVSPDSMTQADMTIDDSWMNFFDQADQEMSTTEGEEEPAADDPGPD